MIKANNVIKVDFKVKINKTKERKNRMDKKREILSKIRKYTADGIVDINKFKFNHPQDYNLLDQYFGDVKKAIDYAVMSKSENLLLAISLIINIYIW